MKRKIGILCGLVICVVVLIIVLWVQLNHKNSENHKNNSGISLENDVQDGNNGLNGTGIDHAQGDSETLAGNGSSLTENTDEGIQENSEAWQSYNQVRNSIVKIDMGEISGSGVVFTIDEDEIVIVSSGHLLEQYDSGIVTFSNGAIAVGWVQGISSASDVGFMTVLISDLDEEKTSRIETVKYDLEYFEKITDGTEIFQVGSTSGVAADFYLGSISAKEWYFEEFDSYMLYNFCKATPGMSGGGCFTNDGKLIGLVSGSYMEESCALPLPAIIEAYEEVMQN